MGVEGITERKQAQNRVRACFFFFLTRRVAVVRASHKCAWGLHKGGFQLRAKDDMHRLTADLERGLQLKEDGLAKEDVPGL